MVLRKWSPNVHVGWFSLRVRSQLWTRKKAVVNETSKAVETEESTIWQKTPSVSFSLGKWSVWNLTNSTHRTGQVCYFIAFHTQGKNIFFHAGFVQCSVVCLFRIQHQCFTYKFYGCCLFFSERIDVLITLWLLKKTLENSRTGKCREWESWVNYFLCVSSVLDTLGYY